MYYPIYLLVFHPIYLRIW